MKISELHECYKVVVASKKMKLPISMSIIFDDNFRKIDPIMHDAEEQRCKYQKCADYEAKVNELLDTDIDINLSKISIDTLVRCDEDSRYDALSGEQVSVIKEFMLIEPD